MAKETDTRRMDAWARLREVAKHETDREEAILEARAAGWSFASIASALGVTAQSVHEYVHRRNTAKGNK